MICDPFSKGVWGEGCGGPVKSTSQCDTQTPKLMTTVLTLLNLVSTFFNLNLKAGKP